MSESKARQEYIAGKQAYKINKPHLERNRFGPKNGKKVSENRRYKLKLNRYQSSKSYKVPNKQILLERLKMEQNNTDLAF